MQYLYPTWNSFTRFVNKRVGILFFFKRFVLNVNWLKIIILQYIILIWSLSLVQSKTNLRVPPSLFFLFLYLLSLTHSLTHSFTHSLIHSLTHLLTNYSLTYSLSLSLSLSLARPTSKMWLAFSFYFLLYAL